MKVMAISAEQVTVDEIDELFSAADTISLSRRGQALAELFWAMSAELRAGRSVVVISGESA